MSLLVDAVQKNYYSTNKKIRFRVILGGQKQENKFKKTPQISKLV